MGVKEVKQQIREGVKFRTVQKVTGGQSVGIPLSKEVLSSEALELEISLGYHRSRLKNRELIYELFELVLDELVK